MNIQTTKLDLMQKLLLIDKESVLSQIQKILDKETVVANTVSGEELSLEEYNNRLLKSEEQINKGEFITQEDLEKESENW